MSLRRAWLAKVTSFSFPLALDPDGLGPGADTGGRFLAAQVSAEGRPYTHLCFTIEITDGGGRRVVGREALVQVPLAMAERQAQVMLRLARWHHGGQSACPRPPIDSGLNRSASDEAAGVHSDLRMRARRRRRRWLARPVGPAVAFPRSFSVGAVNVAELVALSEEQMRQRLTERAHQEHHVCFTVEISEGGGQLAADRRIEVQVQADDADRLARQMLRMITLVREMNPRRAAVACPKSAVAEPDGDGAA